MEAEIDKTSEKISISSEGTDSIEIREITDSEKYIEALDLKKVLKLSYDKDQLKQPSDYSELFSKYSEHSQDTRFSQE